MEPVGARRVVRQSLSVMAALAAVLVAAFGEALLAAAFVGERPQLP
jgi:hypothetical protein